VKNKNSNNNNNLLVLLLLCNKHRREVKEERKYTRYHTHRTVRAASNREERERERESFFIRSSRQMMYGRWVLYYVLSMHETASISPKIGINKNLLKGHSVRGVKMTVTGGRPSFCVLSLSFVSFLQFL
jgi:hypothetical protein